MIGESWLNYLKKDPLIVFAIVFFLLYMSEKSKNEDLTKQMFTISNTKDSVSLHYSDEAKEGWKHANMNAEKNVELTERFKKDTTKR